jgi:uncharacterized coiled-coil protein SlyX
MNQRLVQLEEAYARQQDSINEQANANEVLKFEKMLLMQMHAKRMNEIESALAEIQKTNSASISQHTQPKVPDRFTFG